MGFRGRGLSAGLSQQRYLNWEDKVLKHCIVYCRQNATGVRGREREGGGGGGEREGSEGER